MKDSGVAWLGDIPAEWNIKPLFSFVEEQKNKNSENLVDNVLSLSYGMIKKRELDNGGLLPESFATYQIVEADDIILRLTDLQNDKRSLRVGRSTQRGIITSAYVCIKPTKINSRYLYYLLHAYDLLKVFYNLGGGLRQGMKFDDLKRLPAFDIAPEQQLKIANYLDEETALIDDLIAKQQRLLALLEEKRRATITHAVTRGLNPSVNLKETNIPWLSQVPAHWTIRKLNALTRLVVGSTPSTANSAAFDGDQIWVTISDMNRKNISKSKQMLTKQAVEDKNMELVPKGSLLFSFKLSVGKVGYADIDLYTNEAIAAFLPNDLVEADFLYYAAQTYFINEANTNIYGAALFNQELLRRVRAAFPNIQEQRRIVKFLENEEAKIARMNKTILNQIDLLKERRTSLISHAVTGKVKV